MTTLRHLLWATPGLGVDISALILAITMQYYGLHVSEVHTTWDLGNAEHGMTVLICGSIGNISKPLNVLVTYDYAGGTFISLHCMTHHCIGQ